MPTTFARKPREFILSAAKDGVVGGRVFGEVECLFALRGFLHFLGQPHVDESFSRYTLLMSDGS
jgi:hypothetical protein